MAISMKELAQECVTFEAISGLQPGQICYVNTNNTVKACSDGSPIHGQALSVRCRAANVAVRGFITTNYNGTAPTLGYCPLVAYSNKTVKVSEGAKEYLVVSVNPENKTVCFML